MVINLSIYKNELMLWELSFYLNENIEWQFYATWVELNWIKI
jgi:hypothetical protein